jgi:hypothetical protein
LLRRMEEGGKKETNAITPTRRRNNGRNPAHVRGTARVSPDYARGYQKVTCAVMCKFGTFAETAAAANGDSIRSSICREGGSTWTFIQLIRSSEGVMGIMSVMRFLEEKRGTGMNRADQRVPVTSYGNATATSRLAMYLFNRQHPLSYCTA